MVDIVYTETGIATTHMHNVYVQCRSFACINGKISLNQIFCFIFNQIQLISWLRYGRLAVIPLTLTPC